MAKFSSKWFENLLWKIWNFNIWTRRNFSNVVPWCCSSNLSISYITHRKTYWFSIGLDNGFAPNRRQAIIWTNADLVHWGIYVAPGGDELSPHTTVKCWVWPMWFQGSGQQNQQATETGQWTRERHLNQIMALCMTTLSLLIQYWRYLQSCTKP